MSGSRSVFLGGVLALAAAAAVAEAPVHGRMLGSCGAPAVGFRLVSIHARQSMYQHLDGYDNEGFSAFGATFRAVIAFVFGTGRIEGLPRWAQNDQYDVIAEIKPDDCCQWTSESEQEQSLAVQKMLADKVKLKWHTETRMVSALSLVVKKGGSKVGPSQPEVPASPGTEKPMPMHTWSPRDGYWPGTGSMAEFAQFLSIILDKQVIDKTGLGGWYKFDFPPQVDRGGLNQGLNQGRLIEPDGTPSPIHVAPTMIDYMDKIGLELKSEKVAADFLVIDEIERPAAD